MDDYKTRTRLLLGDGAMEKLNAANVAVVGLGGVGGSCAEALARCGVGSLILMDNDTFDITNLNRQIFATVSQIGRLKTEAARDRLLSIVPELNLSLLPQFFGEETKELLFSLHPDIIVDAIDTVTSKLCLAQECRKRGIPLISSLGTGNRMDPSAFRIGKIEDTGGCGCGLARVMRQECRKRDIPGLDVLYSTEIPYTVSVEQLNGRHSPASVSFCPPAAGYLIASWVVKNIIGE